MRYAKLSVMLGQTIVKITGGEVGDSSVTFQTKSGDTYELMHYQDCCEWVSIEDVCGDWNDLIGEQLVEFEEVSGDEVGDSFKDSHDQVATYNESFTWTFYKFRTKKGSVTMRWLGTSNGYYSESVDFAQVN